MEHPVSVLSAGPEMPPKGLRASEPGDGSRDRDAVPVVSSVAEGPRTAFEGSRDNADEPSKVAIGSPPLPSQTSLGFVRPRWAMDSGLSTAGSKSAGGRLGAEGHAAAGRDERVGKERGAVEPKLQTVPDERGSRAER